MILLLNKLWSSKSIKEWNQISSNLMNGFPLILRADLETENHSILIDSGFLIKILNCR